MGSFSKKVLLFAALQGLLLFLVLCFNQPRETSYMLAYELKKNLLEETEGQRVVFVGGSNLALGMDSGLFMQLTGRRPVNMGLHAGLGRNLIMNQAIIDRLKQDDLVVLSLEYSAFGQMPAGEPAWQLLRVSPSAIFDMSLADLAALLETAFSYTGGQLRNATQNIMRMRFSQPEPKIYTLVGINEFGDLESHWNLGYRKGPRSIQIPELEGRHYQAAIADILGFVQRVRNKDAEVVFAFPPIHIAQYENYAESIQHLNEIIQNVVNVPVILSAKQMAFPEELFFDTAYHLNYAGIRERVVLLGAALKLE